MYQRVPGLSPDGRLAAKWQPCPRCCLPQRVELFAVTSYHEPYPEWCRVCRDDEKRRASRERVAREADMTKKHLTDRATGIRARDVAKPRIGARKRVERD